MYLSSWVIRYQKYNIMRGKVKVNLGAITAEFEEYFLNSIIPVLPELARESEWP
jgi:hypothetical protein